MGFGPIEFWIIMAVLFSICSFIGFFRAVKRFKDHQRSSGAVVMASLVLLVIVLASLFGVFHFYVITGFLNIIWLAAAIVANWNAARPRAAEGSAPDQKG